MVLYFGFPFDEKVLPPPEVVHEEIWFAGPKELLLFFERHLGLAGHPANNEHLRIEQFRQILGREEGSGDESPFYEEAFKADQLATASTVLEMRDELLLAGWTPESGPQVGRLKIFAGLEKLIRRGREEAGSGLPALASGMADRFCELLRALPGRRHPVKQVYHLEPRELLPGHLLRLFHVLREQGIPVEQIPEPELPEVKTDLERFQQELVRPGREPGRLQGDGSVLLLRATRESDAALFLAALLRQNPDFRPACLIPEKNRALDQSFQQEGLPGMGILSASLARPSLQILKLIPVFFWDPIDPYKVLEFLSLPAKPLHPDLAHQIAGLMAQRPGMDSASWKQLIRTFFERLKAGKIRDKQVREIRSQYERWFERRRYDMSSAVPREEVMDCFSYLSDWAREAYEEEPEKYATFLVLSEQARRVYELLDNLPEAESRLSPLELERIVRTIYEPSPITFSEAEVDHLPHCYQPGAMWREMEDLIWWNFCRKEPQHFFSRWRKSEVEALAEAGAPLFRPRQQNERKVWHYRRPVLYTKRRLLLILPEEVAGETVYPHALHDLLEARFTNLEAISYDITTDDRGEWLSTFFELPRRELVPADRPEAPEPWLVLRDKPEPSPERSEYLTQLASLCYFPHQWVFNRHVELRKSPILSIVRDRTLSGNLAHRLFELLFREEAALQWTRSQLDEWLEQAGRRLLPREGAALLLYGREPEQQAFFKTIKNSAWTLLHHIRENGWQVVGSELEVQGEMEGMNFKGKADLVLSRGSENLIVDLKWRGFNYYKQLLRNEEDLQLVLYSKFYAPSSSWAHTAYFIMEEGRLLARNRAAFRECETLEPEMEAEEACERILLRIQRTLAWRLEQFRQGFLEIRSASTAQHLEEYYADSLLDLLEMKTEDAPFDDYQTLVSGID